MSLALDVDQVTQVLLAGRWYTVLDKSFTIDAYEYLWYGKPRSDTPMILHGGGQSGVCSTGFIFVVSEEGERISGPISAIQAVTLSPA